MIPATGGTGSRSRDARSPWPHTELEASREAPKGPSPHLMPSVNALTQAHTQVHSLTLHTRSCPCVDLHMHSRASTHGVGPLWPRVLSTALPVTPFPKPDGSPSRALVLGIENSVTWPPGTGGQTSTGLCAWLSKSWLDPGRKCGQPPGWGPAR